MIDITYVPGKRIDIEGHACYAPKGQDIVCAAISALYCTMIMADGIVGTSDEGHMSATCMRPHMETTFRVFADGMKKIAEKYPTHCAFRIGKYDL